MSKLKAIYPGSFDPVTYGHLDIIKRSSLLFDELIVAVGNNPKKEYLFDTEKRVELLKDSLNSFEKKFKNVKVTSFNTLLVDYAKDVNADVLVRGLRAVTDFEREFQMGIANMDLAPNIETIFLLTKPHCMPISSSLVKEIAMYNGDVSEYTTQKVSKELKRKFSK